MTREDGEECSAWTNRLHAILQTIPVRASSRESVLASYRGLVMAAVRYSPRLTGQAVADVVNYQIGQDGRLGPDGQAVKVAKQTVNKYIRTLRATGELGTPARSSIAPRTHLQGSVEIEQPPKVSEAGTNSPAKGNAPIHGRYVHAPRGVKVGTTTSGRLAQEPHEADPLSVVEGNSSLTQRQSNTSRKGSTP